MIPTLYEGIFDDFKKLILIGHLPKLRANIFL